MVNASIMMTLLLLNLLRQKKQPRSLSVNSGSLLYNILMYTLILKIACRCYCATFQGCCGCFKKRKGILASRVKHFVPRSLLSPLCPHIHSSVPHSPVWKQAWGPKAPPSADCGTCTHPQNNMFFFCSLEIEGCCSCCPVLSRLLWPIKSIRILGIWIILTRK